jgi:hypothetical protein
MFKKALAMMILLTSCESQQDADCCCDCFWLDAGTCVDDVVVDETIDTDSETERQTEIDSSFIDASATGEKMSDFGTDYVRDTGEDTEYNSETVSDHGNNDDSNYHTDINYRTDSDSGEDTGTDILVVDIDTESTTITEAGTDGDYHTDSDSDTELLSSVDAGEVDTETEPEDAPSPRWALRDRFGEPVDGLFYPSPYGEPVIFWEQEPECIIVSYFEQTKISLYYNLDTGRPEDCEMPLENNDSWHLAPSIYFVGPECSGVGYYGYHAPGSDSYYSLPLSVVRINDEFWYIDGEPDHLDIEKYYFWNESSTECTEIDNVSSLAFWRYKRVPDWVLAILPDPPYTLKIEY